MSSPFQSKNERMGTYLASSSLSSSPPRHRVAMKDMEARPIRRIQSSPLACLPPFGIPSSSSEESVFAITRNFLKYQVPARLHSTLSPPRNAPSSKRSGRGSDGDCVVENDGGVEVNVDDSLRQSYDLSRV